MLDDFDARDIDTGETTIFVRVGGSGPPLLLLHGFPETHLMWREVPALAADFTVVCADLRGYGRSGCPPTRDDHAPYAKRAMAQDMAEAMTQLGFPRFGVAGHDRGGRVAYRLALDSPDRVERLAVLDIAPTETVWSRADARLTTDFWPWSLLAQPAPLPERLLEAGPQAVIDDAVSAWGSPAKAFPPDVRSAYAEALTPPNTHAICEEYRAGATIDREHDRADLADGRRIACPVLVLWGRGSLDSWNSDAGGPLAIWRDWADDVQGRRIEGGHFFPEERPEETAEELRRFFGSSPA